jgi:hypothetical protein
MEFPDESPSAPRDDRREGATAPVVSLGPNRRLGEERCCTALRKAEKQARKGCAGGPQGEHDTVGTGAHPTILNPAPGL